MPEPHASTKPRPTWLLAVGTTQPPAEVTIAGKLFVFDRALKADAFALTARYRAGDRLAAVKFCRTQPAFGVPFRWLGRRLADRERFFHARLAEVDAVPADLGEVRVGGRPAATAFARAWVDGHPLQRDEEVAAGFFDAADALVAQAHARGVALVDLDKADNFIVDPDGRPHLLDFQLAFAADRRGFLPKSLAVRGLATQQRCDRYHLLKHRIRQRPDTVAGGDPVAARAELDALRPAWIRRWRRVWRPVILARRRLFVLLGVRTGEGRARSEAGPVALSPLQHPPRLPHAPASLR